VLGDDEVVAFLAAWPSIIDDAVDAADAADASDEQESPA
jgi:hypothetical protein